MTSTIPAGIHCLGSIRKTISWDLDKKETIYQKGRGRNATSHNTAAQLDPRQHPAPSIRYSEQLAERKASGASAGLTLDATCDSGNSCTLGNDPASSQLGSAVPHPH